MALMLMVAGTLAGAEYSFTGNNANWNVEANWSGNVLPGVGDTGVIAGSPGSPRTAYYNATLVGPPDAIRLQADGRLRFNASMTTEHNLVMEGGELYAVANYGSSSTISLRNDSFFWTTGVANMPLSGIVQDYGAEAGRLIVTNGAITLSNNGNSYSGGTRLAGGRVMATQNNSFGTGPIEVLPGGILQFHKVGMILGNSITLDGGSLYTTANYTLFSTNSLKSDSYLNSSGNEPTVSSLFKDYGPGQAGKLIKTGAGGCYFTNPNNSYSGGTRIEGGRMWLKVNNTLGTGPVEVVTNGMLYFDANLTLKNPIILDGGVLGAGANYTLTSTNWIRSRGELWSTAATPKILGPIRDEDAERPGQIVKTGSGNFYVTAATNTYSGGTLVKEGMLICDAATVSPPSGEQCLGRGDVIVTNGATLRLTGMKHANHPDASIIILSNATIRFHTSNFNKCTTNVIVKAGGHLYSSGVYITGYYTSYDNVRIEGCVDLHRYEGDPAAGYNQWYGTFSDGAEPGQLAVVGTNSGLTQLRGTNTYTGGTIIRDGGPEAAELSLAGNGRMPDTGTILTEQNGVMNFNNITDTVGGLAGAGLVKLGSGTVTCAEEISPGTNALHGCTLSVTGTTGRVILGSQSVSTFHLRTPGNQDRVVLTGGATLTLGGDLKVEKLGTLDEGAYTIFDLADGAAPLGAFTNILMPDGYSGRVAVVGNDVVLTIAKQGMIFTLR